MGHYLRVEHGKIQKAPEARFDQLPTRSRYFEREANWGNETIKQPIRERVLRYFLDISPPTGKHDRVFGLAGLHWQFEAMWLACYGSNATAFSVERDYQTWARSIGWIPGLNRNRYDLPLVSGNLEHARTDRAASLWMELRSFVGLNRTDWHAKADKAWFRKTFKTWTAAWLDYCGDWDSRKAETIMRLGSCYDMNREVAPLAITLQLGRGEDPGTPRALDPVSRRIEAIREVANGATGRRYEHDHTIRYETAGGVHMIVALGRMIRTPVKATK